MNVQNLNKRLLALNVVLAVTLSVLVLSRFRTSPAPPAIRDVASNEPPVAVSQSKPRAYSDLAAAADWRQWIDMLRDAGVPTRILARLVREGFDDAWQKRAGETYADYMRGDIDTDGLAVANLEHDMEQEKAIRAALGEEDFKKWDMANILQSINLRGIQLTPAETGALYMLEKKTRQRFDELQLSKLKGEIDQATMEELQAKNQADHDEQLKALLGEQRYATMHGTDEGAGDLQRGLTASGMELPADVPFETLLALQNQWNERHREMEGQIVEAKSQISNWELELKRLDDARERALQRVLGTNAFDALEMGQDTRYTEMKRYADAWGLDNTSMDYIYRTIKYYEKAVNDYQQQARALEAQGQDVDWDAVNQNVQQFAQQTEQALRNYLGDERFNKIKNNEIFPFASAK